MLRPAYHAGQRAHLDTDNGPVVVVLKRFRETGFLRVRRERPEVEFTTTPMRLHPVP